MKRRRRSEQNKEQKECEDYPRTLYRCIHHTTNEIILQDWKKAAKMRILISIFILYKNYLRALIGRLPQDSAKRGI